MTCRQTYGYARVSSDRQAEEGLSLDAQIAKIHQMAALRDLTVAETILDPGFSAKSLQRPGLTRLLALVDAGAVDAIIVAKLDRLTRSVRDIGPLLERFERRRVALVSVAETLDTSTAMGRAVLNIIVSMSQWERESAGERTRDVLRHKKAQGELAGQLPFGFHLAEDGPRVHRRGCQTRGLPVEQCACGGRIVQIEPDAAEQAQLARMRALQATGQSYRQIRATLTAEGVTTRKGTPLRHQWIARVLKCG